MALAKTLSRNVEVLGAGPQDRIVLDPGVQLAISVELRDQDFWCWAAVSRGVQLAYGDNPAELQCEVARRVKNTTCCPAGDHSVCDQPHDLTEALADHFDKFIDNKFLSIKDCIDTGFPPAVRIGFDNAESGHFVVISGYYKDGGLNYIWVFDPADGVEHDHEFEAFKLGDPNVGSWDRTYRTTGQKRVPTR